MNAAPGPNNSLTASSAPARLPWPREACPPPAASGPRSWPPSATRTSSTASKPPPPTYPATPPPAPGPPAANQSRAHGRPPRTHHKRPPPAPAGALPGTGTGTGTFTYTGPVTPATIRKIACDADIIPILLGSEGRILDIGRTTRIFPPHIRKAITARDQGCTFPNCTIPAPWCEAHHTTYWSHGGPTSTENGTLLCTHHHHLIHKEQWTIQMQTGIPWFIPPPHIDPQQKPRRNHQLRN